MTITPDQQDLWAAQYGLSPAAPDQPSAFARQSLPLLDPGSTVLELGCGTGADADRFATASHRVVATDFVPAVIAANRERLAHISNLSFETMRIDGPYRFADDTFDAVYAHLTLHYFPHEVTCGILREIRRVLRPGGLLLVACKSPADPAYGKGVEIEPDMFDFHGKVRHFLSEAYARALLADEFTDVTVESHRGKLYRQRAGWITAIARAS